MLSGPANTTEGEVGTNRGSTLESVDIIIIVAYFVLTLMVGVWASCSGSKKTIPGYFLAGRNATWWAVGASLFASNIGTGHFIGLAGTGAASGVAVASYEWLAPFIILALGWWFLPIYLSSKVYTMPEYLSKRYGGQRLRVLLTIISMFLYVLTKIAVDLYAGAIFIQHTVGINMYLAIISLLVITSLYTVFGGLKAVIYTDALQTAVMLIGGGILMILGFREIGGYSELEKQYSNSFPNSTRLLWKSGFENTTCGVPRSDSFHIFRHPVNSDMPWPAMLMGIMLLGSWYWCTDQVIVQRTLAAKSLPHAQGGCILAGFLKLIPMYLIVMVGMISRIIFPNTIACSSAEECRAACQNEAGCSNMAYPMLVTHLLPTGLRGVMIAAMLSALMSSLTSIFNSTSTIFTIDVWKRLRPTASDKELLIVGKITVVILVAISIIWIPVLLTSAGGQLFVYLQMIQSALGPPIFAIYVYGIVWPRINEKGAFWGLLSGFLMGLVRLILDFYYKPPTCDQLEYRPPAIYKVNYLYVAPIVFVITSLVMITVSFATKPTNTELDGLTWQTMHDKNNVGRKNRRKVRDSYEMDSLNEEETKEVHNTKDENFPQTKSINFLLSLGAILLIVVSSFCMGYYA